MHQFHIIYVSFSVKTGPHTCSVCKTTVDKSRLVNQKSLAQILGLREDEIGGGSGNGGSDSPPPRVCNPCYVKAQKKKHGHCPMPTCTSTRGRNKGRLRHMPAKWIDLSKDIQEMIANELRMFLNI